MSGFQRKTYRLVFAEDTEWAGLEVRLRGLSVDGLTKLATLADLKDVDPDDFSPEMIEKLEPVWEVLAHGLISWNLEDENGEPVLVKSFRGEDMGMLLAILNEWSETVGGVTAALKARSRGGSTFPEGSLPMEALSPSRAS